MNNKEAIESDNKQALPVYDVVKVISFHHSEIISKLIEDVNEKIKQGYVPIGGIAVVNSHPTYCAYQAIMLNNQHEDTKN